MQRRSFGKPPAGEDRRNAGNGKRRQGELFLIEQEHAADRHPSQEQGADNRHHRDHQRRQEQSVLEYVRRGNSRLLGGHFIVPYPD